MQANWQTLGQKERGKEIRQTNNKKILFSNYKISVWQVLQEIDEGVSLLSVFMCFYLFGFAAKWWILVFME